MKLGNFTHNIKCLMTMICEKIQILKCILLPYIHYYSAKMVLNLNWKYESFYTTIIINLTVIAVTAWIDH